MKALSFQGRVVFVTGASGFLGSAITAALLGAGASVRALARGPLPVGLERARVVRGELLDTEALDAGLAGAEFVFHVAADLRMYPAALAEATRTNVDGTRLLLQRARVAGVRRVVFTSSGSTLGKPLDATRGPIRPIDETSAYAYEGLGWVYPETKWRAENVVRAAVKDGQDALITHPTAIFGPGDWKGNLLPLLRAPRTALGWFATNGVRNVCDVRDVADGHLRAALHGRAGESYALSGEALEVGDLMRRIAREVGGHAPRVTLPAPVVISAARALQRVAAWRGRAPLLSVEMAAQSCLRTSVSSDKAMAELGYRSRPADESIRDAVAFHKERGTI